MTDAERWLSPDEKPGINEGTKIGVVIEGTRETADGTRIEGVFDGWYLNEYGLHMRDGCECFDPIEEAEDFEDHSKYGCPFTGFFTSEADPEGDFGSLFIDCVVRRWRIARPQEDGK